MRIKRDTGKYFLIAVAFMLSIATIHFYPQACGACSCPGYVPSSTLNYNADDSNFPLSSTAVQIQTAWQPTEGEISIYWQSAQVYLPDDSGGLHLFMENPEREF